MNKLLTDEDRKFVLSELQKAPNSVLARAYLEWSEVRSAVLVVRSNNAQPSTKVVVEQPEPAEPVNTSPGISTITRIGNTAREEIIAQLRDGRQPHAKYEEHCKLLWERGEIKFDGKEFYL